MSPESAKADSCGAEPTKPFEMSHRSRSSTTSFPLWSALQRRCKNLTRRPLALRKIQRSLQRAQKVCSRQIVLLLCCPKNCAGSVTCECSSMFEPPCAIFLLKHSFTGFTASSTGLDGNPEADGLPSCRVKRYKKGLGRHAKGHVVSQSSITIVAAVVITCCLLAFLDLSCAFVSIHGVPATFHSGFTGGEGDDQSHWCWRQNHRKEDREDGSGSQPSMRCSRCVNTHKILKDPKRS